MSLNRLPRISRHHLWKLATGQIREIPLQCSFKRIVCPFHPAIEIKKHHTPGCLCKGGCELLNARLYRFRTQEIDYRSEQQGNPRCDRPGESGLVGQQQQTGDKWCQRAADNKQLVGARAQHFALQTCLLLAQGNARYAVHNHWVFHP